MKHPSHWFKILATLTVLVFVGGQAAAVLRVQEGSLVLQNDSGQPMPQAEIRISFNGTTEETKTDDRGAVPILLVGDSDAASDRDDSDDDRVVLIGNGEGRIFYPGGPEEGEVFVVRDGAIAIPSPGPAGLSTKTWAFIGGGAAGGLLLLSTGGDSTSPSAVSTGSSTSTTPTSTSSSSTSAPTESANASLVGVYTCTTNVKRNPKNHPVLLKKLMKAEVREEGGHTKVFSDDPAWIPVQGTPANNSLVATGNGSYAGYGTRAELDVTTNATARTMTGEYCIGVDGSLPGNESIVWDIVCNGTAALR
jgi:hypothetical protein